MLNPDFVMLARIEGGRVSLIVPEEGYIEIHDNQELFRLKDLLAGRVIELEVSEPCYADYHAAVELKGGMIHARLTGTMFYTHLDSYGAETHGAIDQDDEADINLVIDELERTGRVELPFYGKC